MSTFPRFHAFLALLLLAGSLAAGCATVDRATVSDQPTETRVSAVAPDAAAEASYLDEAPLDASLPLAPDLVKGELDNGLTYYVRTNGRPEKRAELRLFVRAGSLQEDEDQRGLAHFVEHMAFNGTRRFEKQEIVDYLESIGMRFGPDINAYTSFDETVYMLTVPTDDDAILARAFEILEDWAHGIAFDGEEIDKERGVVVEEWRLGRGAAARIRDQQFPILFQGSRYAERLPIGEKEILETAPYDALKRFYRDWYRPDLMAVAAVGDFDPGRVEELIRKHFSGLQGPPQPRPREVWPVPDHEETLWSFTTDPEIPNTTVSVFYKLPLPGEGTFGDYRRAQVEALYSAMLNARLGEIAQRPDPPFLFGYAAKNNLVLSRAVYVQAAAVREGGVERGLEAVLTEAERVDRHGFAAGELERAKKDLVRTYEQAFRERDKQPSAALAAELGRNFLTAESVPGIAAELRLVERFLPAIDLAEVNELARDWITEDNRVILVSGPQKEGAALPVKEDLQALFAAIPEREVEPWVDEVLDEPLVAAAPAPGAVTETAEIAEIGVTEWRLANGVKVVLRPTDFRNDQVLLQGFSPGGHSLASDQDYLSASFATAIVSESGFGNFSSIELEKALAGKVAGGSPFIGELEEGYRGSASPEDLETLLQLVYLAFTAPRLDADATQSLMSRYRILLENRLSDPATVFRDELARVLSGDHPRNQPLSPELLDQVDPEKALAVYRDRFADASDFTFVMVGNFEAAALRPLVETWLGGLPSTAREETWRDVGVRTPDEVVRFEVEKGLEPKSQVRLIFTGPATWSREASHDVRSLAEVLNLRLREVLREDMGATYGVGVGGSIALRPREEYTVRISFGCAPDAVENLVDVIFAELEAAREKGVDEGDLGKVKEALRRQREVDLKENGYWLSALANYYSHGHDPRWILDVEEESDAVTLERVREAARRYLDPARYVLGVLYPEETPPTP
ncbi:MAG TPA: insulinase family protein [Thermoanaerobaculia bacterium]